MIYNVQLQRLITYVIFVASLTQMVTNTDNLASAQTERKVRAIHPDQMCKSNNCFMLYFKQESVRQSTAPTITRTPTHTLSCILEYTIARSPEREDWQNLGNAETLEPKTKNQGSPHFVRGYQCKCKIWPNMPSTLRNSSYSPNYTWGMSLQEAVSRSTGKHLFDSK